MSILKNTHIGRSFSDTRLEDLCPCPKEACGLVNTDNLFPDCEQHPAERSKTIRQSHKDDECPENIQISFVDEKDIPFADLSMKPNEFEIIERDAKKASQSIEEFILGIVSNHVNDSANTELDEDEITKNTEEENDKS